jgi:hypothetical protein
MTGKIKPLKLYSRNKNQRPGKQVRGFGAHVDARTTAGRQLKAFEAQLIKHVGGQPTVPQQVLITRCAWLNLKLSLLEAKAAQGADTEYDAKTYGSWANSLRRCLYTLGLNKPTAPTLQRRFGDAAPPAPAEPTPDLGRLPGFRWAEPGPKVKADGE